MAASAIDEAVRNCVAVGADPSRIAILDNFCWGDCEEPETLGTLVRAALACQETAVALGTPFISGKDSLNNVFRFTDETGKRQTISIPPSLLISAIGQMADVRRAVTMDLKESGNLLYQVGATRHELGGSHFALVNGLSGGEVPQVDPPLAKVTFHALHKAINAGLVRACHDLSEGGLAAAVAEAAFSGGLGARVELGRVPYSFMLDPEAQERHARLAAEQSDVTIHPLAALPEATAVLLFSESNSRFLCEVPPTRAAEFEQLLAGVPCGQIGEVTETGRLEALGLPRSARDKATVIDADLNELKEAWQKPLRW
jgi:phosphoribosylformylglycinamidine synthase